MIWARLAVVVGALIPAVALACSCRDAADMSPQENAATLRQYPHVVSARILSKQEPLTCRVGAFRWVFSVVGAKTNVTYILKVSKTVRGPELRVASVVQEQVFGDEGCYADKSNSCGRDYHPQEEIWALKRRGSDKFERAGLCDEHRVRGILNV